MNNVDIELFKIEYFKNDCTVRELAKKFNINVGTLLKLIETHIETRRPTKVHFKKTLSNETKAKLSNSMKKAHSEDRHPGWCAVNSKIEDSYPEKRFKEFLIKNEITNKYTIFSKFQIGKYCLDFVLLELKINIELDGQYHFHDKTTINRDSLRDEYMKSNGWRVFRVSWTKFMDNEDEVLTQLNTFINDTSTTTTKLYSEKDFLIDGVVKIDEFSHKIKIVKKCIKCDREITQYSKCCRKCVDHTNPIMHKRKFEISKEELEKLLKTNSKVKIGKMYGVSDNAIKKRAISYGLLGNKT